MNNLLRDLIEVEDVAVFIDNVMMVIETEEEYNNIMEKVLRKITNNNLFVKPEKCVWKVREVGFLGVVIGLDRIKMEKKKFQRVVVLQLRLKCLSKRETLYWLTQENSVEFLIQMYLLYIFLVHGMCTLYI